MGKRSLILALCLLMLALCACGGTEPEASTAEPNMTAPPQSPSPSRTPEERPETGSAPTLPDSGLHTAEETPAEDGEIAARRALALDYIDRDAEELIQALGEPLERHYAPSCLGGGEDGELVYEGFTVYTYREGDRETVTDVS